MLLTFLRDKWLSIINKLFAVAFYLVIEHMFHPIFNLKQIDIDYYC